MNSCSSLPAENLELPLAFRSPARPKARLADELAAFHEFGQPTRVLKTQFPCASAGGAQTLVRSNNQTDTGLPPAPPGAMREVPTFVNEFWTARQRQASSLHEVSYRACFKPQLPRFFIERLTEPGESVYDPFMGRGTTPLEAALLGRVPVGNDVNPLSVVLTRPRLNPPSLTEVAQRLQQIPLDRPADTPADLLVFFHPDTLRAISSLKRYLLERAAGGALDTTDEWIALVSLNRLTGHSPGFFSVYTLPPNQAVSARSQAKINAKRKQTPPPRDVVKLILKKTRQLLADVNASTRQTLARSAAHALLITAPAHATPQIPSASVALVVTSPPFLNVVQYAIDNWLRCWFVGVDAEAVQLTTPTRVDTWQAEMTRVFAELYRVLKPGGHIAFEVGEVHAGATRLEEAVLPCATAVGLEPLLVMINDQKFTKTANCWGVDNMARGTNTNRIVVLRKS